MKMKVLIVDDSQINVTLLSHLVNRIEGCHSIGYTDPQEALAWCTTHLPDLLLLDYMMPDMNGIEFLHRFRAIPGREHVPVLMVTANDQVTVRHESLEAGANDFLTKTTDKIEFSARVRNMLALRAAQLNLEEKNQILSEEKELLESIVTRMRSASPFDGYRVKYLLSSLERTAGDLVLSARTPQGAQYVMVGDFAGHGLPAALGGPLVSWMFYHMAAEGCPLHDILREINLTLCRQLPAQIYLAASAIELDPERRQAAVWNCSMPPVLCLSKEQALVRIKSSGLPLGVLETESFQPHAALEVRSGMRFYQYSDGLTEAASPAMEMFGQARLEKLIEHIYVQGLPLEEIWTSLQAYCQSMTFTDDALITETSV